MQVGQASTCAVHQVPVDQNKASLFMDFPAFLLGD